MTPITDVDTTEATAPLWRAELAWVHSLMQAEAWQEAVDALDQAEQQLGADVQAGMLKGQLCMRLGQPRAAAQALSKVLAMVDKEDCVPPDPATRATAISAVALLRTAGAPAEALARLEALCRRDPDLRTQTRLSQAQCLGDLGRFNAALRMLDAAAADGQPDRDTIPIRARILSAQGYSHQAARLLEDLTTQTRAAGHDSVALQALSVRALIARADWDAALTDAQALLDRAHRESAPPDALREAHELLMLVHLNRNEPKERLAVARAMAESLPQVPEAIRGYATALWWEQQFDDSLAVLDAALVATPDDPSLLWLRSALSLLPQYDTEADRDQARAAHQQHIERLWSVLAADPTSAFGFDPLAVHYPFHLPYAGSVDLTTQRRIGSILQRATAVPKPTPSTIPSRGDPDVRPLVVFVSGFWRNHTVCKLFRRWVTDLDRQRFRVGAVHLGGTRDAMTDEIEGCCDLFLHQSGQPVAVAETLIEWRPDVLVYPELGMHLETLRVAAQRLAPLQAVAWGHPSTTGLDSVDVFLSSALMEPDCGASQYTEDLETLPGLSVCYDPSVTPLAQGAEGQADRRQARTAFGFTDDDIVLLCLQHHAKYRPGDDGMLAAILASIPNSRLILVAQKPPTPPDGLRNRLLSALHRHSGQPTEALEHKIQLVPMMPLERWRQLNVAGDIFLDTPGWSGGNTTLEAVVCGLPVVTWPGGPDLPMRARHSAAILTAIGCPETIAETSEDYVAITCALAEDPARRAALRDRYLAQYPAVYADRTPIRALEDVLERRLREKSAP